MENLVGHPDRDRIIEEELMVCRIDPVHLERPNGHEVNASVQGKLGDIRFVRGWYYWIVDGHVPLFVAQRLYEDPLGRRDVRVNGHCGRPAPNPRDATIDCYHIDSLAGLRLFADVVRDWILNHGYCGGCGADLSPDSRRDR